ncbi:MAG: metal-sensitive transcriptional regulator [Gammaproteobacteria bacterium]|jgi:CsoR family transcriptional regulator, copper-sensing transcriptional repressor|nr:metal-sensitive transcriptional regulator [Gammaproteobacteria bacterium]|tara:strand:+ start:1290 stop:1553 length:264 start_codon:yes stop_codon:yes gene_type:complete
MKNLCHKKRIAALRRVEGQINGVIRMIESGQYCIDILNQTKAAKNALITVEGKILEAHLSSCIHDSFGDPNIADKKIEELIKVLKRN